MAEKKGAGGEPQAYDERTGRYGGGSENANREAETTKIKSAIRIYSDDPVEDIEKRGIQISATNIRSEVMRKQSQRGYQKKVDYAYNANEFVIFKNYDIGDYDVLISIPIVGNEEEIDYLWRWIDKHG